MDDMLMKLKTKDKVISMHEKQESGLVRHVSSFALWLNEMVNEFTVQEGMDNASSLASLEALQAAIRFSLSLSLPLSLSLTHTNSSNTIRVDHLSALLDNSQSIIQGYLKLVKSSAQRSSSSSSSPNSSRPSTPYIHKETPQYLISSLSSGGTRQPSETKSVANLLSNVLKKQKMIDEMKSRETDILALLGGQIYI
jgi:hypothetical protein